MDQILFQRIMVAGQVEQEAAKTPSFVSRQLSKCITIQQKHLNVYSLERGMQITFLV